MCHRTLFPYQVKHCIHSNYKKNLHIVASCLTGKYVHVCNNHCQGPEQCTVPDERTKEWICHNCDSHLKAGHKSSIAVTNNTELAPIPSELCDLNETEMMEILERIENCDPSEVQFACLPAAFEQQKGHDQQHNLPMQRMRRMH